MENVTENTEKDRRIEKGRENEEKGAEIAEKAKNEQMAALFTSITLEVQKYPPRVAMGALSGTVSLILECFHGMDPKFAENSHLEFETFLKTAMERIQGQKPDS